MDNNFKFSTSVIGLPVLFLMLIWFVSWLEVYFHLDFLDNGIFPRTLFGLQGIIFSPFIHANFEHLLNNSSAILILFAAIRYFYRKISYQIIIYGILFSGLLTWIIGRPSYHIGASGLIYVLISFIFFKGIQTKFYRLVALSFTVVLLYGGMIWYIFPHPEVGSKISISWEGHLSGFFTGIFFCFIFKTPEYHKPIFYEWENPDFNPEEDDFMKCFDENGNFIDKIPVSDSDFTDLEENQVLSADTNHYIYHYKEKVV